MKTKFILPAVIIANLLMHKNSFAQDTFSIVGADSLTGEVGSAGASCVDLFAAGFTDPSFLGDLIPTKGAINTQAAYITTNQNNARTRMNLGDTPPQIISWLQANDAGGNPFVRQYGIVGFVGGSPVSAAYTGTNCLNYKNHITGKNYSIQGNILLGQQILDSMEARFKNTVGTLACKLMAALQGAKVVGADTRCSTNGTSSLFAFLKVTKPGDAYGTPYIKIGVRTATNSAIEPIDSLQKIANSISLCSIGTGINKYESRNYVSVYPNPSTGNINIFPFGLMEGQLNVIVEDVTGKIVYNNNVTINNGNASFILDAKNGVYFISIINKETGQRVIKKLIIQK